MTDKLPTHPVEATLDHSDDRWVLRMERTLNHPAERVWAALTRADEVRRWAPYAPDRDLDVVGEVPLPQAEGGEPAEGPPEPGRGTRGRRTPAARLGLGRASAAF